ncbi:hypothetical protein [Erythrobacter sp.]|uniref:hypothetical protein n=1 Tax=Erythrobacter sp. TaxID=1042 RepID=UPI001425C828|nr:hypothetical protein [Erythrobacter sp.]QIQ85801.1 MAG: hypothetical protein G9473_03195 [Erythrobacter sp.]
MTVANIIDRRAHPYRWKRIQAIVEATAHDNGVEGADEAEPGDPGTSVLYKERDGISVSEAVAWATAMPCEVTLYLYEEGTN